MNILTLLAEPSITMGASAIAGFFMKLKALDNERQQQERLQTLEAFKVGMQGSTDSANAAVVRAGDSWGKMTRRFIAWTLILAVVALVFVPGFADKPAIVQTVKESGGWIFGLFPSSTKVEFHELNGFVHMPALIAGFGHIVAFYFGQAAAKP